MYKRQVTVYMYLRSRADREGKCFPSVRTISRDTKLSMSTVRRALDDLVKTIGIVYTYSKGWEILTLPLSTLPSYSFLLSFNVWMYATIVVDCCICVNNAIIAYFSTASDSGMRMNYRIVAHFCMVSYISKRDVYKRQVLKEWRRKGEADVKAMQSLYNELDAFIEAEYAELFEF